MDFEKLMLYANILGICFPIALTYIVIANLITNQPIHPIAILGLGFGYAFMFKRNHVFRELWEKWFKNKN